MRIAVVGTGYVGLVTGTCLFLSTDGSDYALLIYRAHRCGSVNAAEAGFR